MKCQLCCSKSGSAANFIFEEPQCLAEELCGYTGGKISKQLKVPLYHHSRRRLSCRHKNQQELCAYVSMFANPWWPTACLSGKKATRMCGHNWK